VQVEHPGTEHRAVIPCVSSALIAAAAAAATVLLL
jgi:hypothetical protein